MAFFAQPNLDNTQFKQLGDSVLDLSGQTRILTTTGLTLIGDGDVNIPIVATGATNTYVLTYDGTVGTIRLMPSTGGGAGVYTYSANTTCTVGGLAAGQNIYNDPIVDIIQCMTTPTLNPSLSNPKITSFSISPSTLLYEVGDYIPNITASLNYYAGQISPQYVPTESSCRSCGTICYNYSLMGTTSSNIVNSPSDSKSLGDATINLGSNYVFGDVCYCSGVQPYNSAGGVYNTPLPVGSSECSKNIIGIFPYYWGNISSGGVAAGINRPITQTIVDNIEDGTANKVVNHSSSTFGINFGSTTDDYIWFAIPSTNPIKLKWWENGSTFNGGTIGGIISVGGNFFPDPVIDVDVVSSQWAGVGYSTVKYDVYLANYQSAAGLLNIYNS